MCVFSSVTQSEIWLYEVFEFEAHVLWTWGLTGPQRHSTVCAFAHVYDV